jgi:hypothetical protein
MLAQHYLLLHNEKIRDSIDTIGKKSVLLLRRFTEGGIAVLEGSVSFRACFKQYSWAAKPPVQTASRIPSAVAVRRIW